MFAVIKSGGRQYKVSVGEKLQVNRLVVDAGDQVRFEEVLLISNDENTTVGTPLVSNALVLATATQQGRGEKLIVFKYKSKKRYRHRRGHRQELTFLTIDDIVAEGKSLITGEAPAFREKEVPTVEESETTDEETPTTENVDEDAPLVKAPKLETEKKPSRRRRSTRAEDTNEKAEE